MRVLNVSAFKDSPPREAITFKDGFWPRKVSKSFTTSRNWIYFFFTSYLTSSKLQLSPEYSTILRWCSLLFSTFLYVCNDISDILKFYLSLWSEVSWGHSITWFWAIICMLSWNLFASLLLNNTLVNSGYTPDSLL